MAPNSAASLQQNSGYSGKEIMLALNRVIVAAAFLLAAGAGTAGSHAVAYSFDGSRSDVTFTYYVGFISQSGHFKQLSGTFKYDPAAAEGASIEAAIKTESLSASSWESELKGSDFFDIAKFPEIRFKSRSARRTGETSAEFAGDLTMKGVTRPIALQAEIKNRTHVTATTRIKRSDFNMTALSYLVGDTIDIKIEGELIEKPASVRISN